jgi:hypothetical protein
MAWLGTDALPIVAGWGGPPQLNAPNIGELVKSILANKLARDKMGQENIADAIKNIREERQSNAYIDQLRAAGLLPEGDIGGAYGAKNATTLAKMIQDKREADALAGYREKLGTAATTRADAAADYASIDEPETYTDEKGREWRKTRSGWTLIPKYGQASITPQQTAQEEAVRPAYEAAQAAQTEAERRKGIVEERFGPPTEGTFPGLAGGKKARVEAKYLRRLQEEVAAKKTQAELAKKYPGLTTPQTDQAGGGADKNLAPDYGQAVSDADVEAMTWARAHPDDPRSAAILKRLGLQ